MLPESVQTPKLHAAFGFATRVILSFDELVLPKHLQLD